jgi:hypothetical protein
MVPVWSIGPNNTSETEHMREPHGSEGPGDTQTCKNCSATLSNQYCSVCGQRAQVRIVSLWEFMRDVIDELFFLESRVWRTLGPLLFRPGMLTMDYLAGRRARYVPPVRLYIVLSVIFFVVISLTDTVQIDTGADTAIEDIGKDLPARPDARAPGIASDDDGVVGAIELSKDEMTDSCTIDDAWVDSVPFGAEIRDELLTTCEKILTDRGEAFRNALAEDIPLMMIFFLPLLAVSMKILYLFSRRYYVEHLLFFVHYHAFGFLLLTLLTLSDEVAESFTVLETANRFVFWGGLVYLFVYLFRAMRRVYGQGRLVTGIKYFVLSICYVVFLALSFTGTAVYTALTL